MDRDTEINHRLEAMGWTVLRFWEEDINKHLDKCITNIKKAIEKSKGVY